MVGNRLDWWDIATLDLSSFQHAAVLDPLVFRQLSVSHLSLWAPRLHAVKAIQTIQFLAAAVSSSDQRVTADRRPSLYMQRRAEILRGPRDKPNLHFNRYLETLDGFRWLEMGTAFAFCCLAFPCLPIMIDRI